MMPRLYNQNFCFQALDLLLQGFKKFTNSIARKLEQHLVIPITRKTTALLLLKPGSSVWAWEIIRQHFLYCILRLVLFDLGDTLVYVNKIIYERAAKHPVAKAHRVSATMIQKAIRQEWAKRYQTKRDFSWVTTDEAEYSYWLEFFQSVLKRLGIHRDGTPLARWLAEKHMDPKSFECFKDVHPVLKALRKRHIKLGIISNGFPSAIKILHELGIEGYFDNIIVSYQIPDIQPKPNVQIYKYALEQIVVHPEIKPYRVLFIDDRSKFVEGALTAELQALQIDRKKDTSQKKEEIYKITSLSCLC